MPRMLGRYIADLHAECSRYDISRHWRIRIPESVRVCGTGAIGHRDDESDTHDTHGTHDTHDTHDHDTRAEGMLVLPAASGCTWGTLQHRPQQIVSSSAPAATPLAMVRSAAEAYGGLLPCVLPSPWGFVISWSSLCRFWDSERWPRHISTRSSYSHTLAPVVESEEASWHAGLHVGLL